MANTASLDRLEALLARLRPIATVQRGEPIRSQDWNQLVSSVMDVARALFAEDQTQAVPAHEHLDQVTADWLASTLRDRVEGGPLTTLSVDERLRDLDRKLSSVGDRLSDLTSEAGPLAARVDGLLAKDVARERAVVSLHQAIDTVRQSQIDVGGLRTTLQSVQEKLATAIDLGKRLEVGGQPVDLAAVDRRIGALEGLREKLRTPSGDLLDAAQLEARLTGLVSQFATKDDLGALRAERPEALRPDELAALEDRLRASTLAEVASTTKDARAELGRQLGEALADVDGRVARAVSDASGPLTEALLAKTRGELASTLDARSGELRSWTEGRLGDLDRALSGRLEEGVASVQRDLSSALRMELDRELPGRMAAFAQTLETLTSRLDGALRAVDLHESRLGLAEGRVEAIARDDGAARGELSQLLLDEMRQRDALATQALEGRLAALGASFEERLSMSAAATRRAAVDEARAAATEAAVNETRLSETRMRGEMRSVAREEVATPARVREVSTPAFTGFVGAPTNRPGSGGGG